MKKILAICTLLVAFSMFAWAAQKPVQQTVPATKASPQPALSAQAQYNALVSELRSALQTGADVTALKERLALLSKEFEAPRSSASSLDRACNECTPEDVDLGDITNVEWAGLVSGNCGNEGKWVGRFNGIAGSVYHFDLCPTAPGNGTNAGFDAAPHYTDVDIKVTDGACAILGGVDGLSSCVPSWSPNDFQFTCSITGTYYVIIAPYSSYNQHNCQGAADETFTLNYYAAGAVLPPANDACNGAIALTIPSSLQVDNTTGTDDVTPYCGTSTPVRGLWYTVVGNGHRLTWTTCNAYGTNTDTRLQVFTGSCGNFTCVVGNDDMGFGQCSYGTLKSAVTWCAQEGVTYYLIAGGYTGYWGTFQLDLVDVAPCNTGRCCYDNGASCATNTLVECDALGGAWTAELSCETSPCPPPTPANDNCADAIALTVNADQPTCGTTAGATLDCPQNYYPEVWYSFTLDACSDVSIQYCGTPPTGSLMNVLYSESCCGTVVNASSAEYSSCADGLVSIHFNNLAAGQYWLPVGLSDAGQFCVRVAAEPCSCPAPINYCENPIIVPGGLHFEQTVNTCCATHSVPFVWSYGCEGSQYTAGPSVIWQIVLQTSGTVTFTANADFDDQIMVFTDCANPTGTCVGSADAVGSPEVIPNLFLAAGTYYVSVSGYAYETCGTIGVVMDGDVPLSVSLAAEPTVTPGDGSLTLKWATASENNNARFDIVRDAQVVASVNGAGNSPTRQDYTWTESGLSNGTTYRYTLRSVSVAGIVTELATVSGVPSFNAATVSEYALHQNYPNPFNPTTSIALDLVDGGLVSLKVYNLMGQEVASLVNGNLTAGRHIVSFDAQGLSSGIYLYRLNVNGFSAEKKMLLMK